MEKSNLLSSRNLALAALVALLVQPRAKEEPTQSQAPQAAGPTKEFISAPIKKPIEVPKTHLLNKEATFETPAVLKMSPEEFRLFSQGLSEDLRGKLTERLEKNLKQYPDNKLGETLGFLKSFFIAAVPEDFEPFFDNWSFDRGDIREFLKKANQYLNPAGYQLQIQGGGETQQVGIFPISKTDTLYVEDQEGSAEFPVFYLGKNLLARHFTPFPETVKGKADLETGAMLVFPTQGERESKQQVEALAEQGFPIPDLQTFIRSSLEDTLNHEGTHLLLLRRFAALTENKQCKEVNVPIDIPGYSLIKASDCVTPLQVHEMCGYGAQFANTDMAGLWNLAINLSNSSWQTANNKMVNGMVPLLVLGNFRQPVTPEMGAVLDSGHYPRKEMWALMPTSVFGLEGVHSTGQEMYSICYSTLEGWQAER